MRTFAALLTSLLLASSIVFAQTPAAIDMSLTVSNKTGTSRVLHFGIDCNASDNIDASLGEEEQPPSPPAGVFDARFIGTDISVALGQGILKDFRNGNASQNISRIHEIQYQVAAGDTATISWSLPGGVTGVLQDFLTGTLVNASMSGSGSLKVIYPTITRLKMTITYSSPEVPPVAITQGTSGVTHAAAVMKGAINPNARATTYQFQYGTTTGYGSTTPSVDGGSAACTTGVSATVTGLLPSTTYHYRIVATNSIGTTQGSDNTFTTGSATAPTVVTNAATGVTASKATVNGTVNPNGAATTYQFEYGTTTSYGSVTTSRSAGTGTSVVTVTDSLIGLSPNTTYHFRLSATSSLGTVQGSDQTFTTNFNPPTVTTTAATSISSAGAQINGTVNPNGSLTTCQFEYGLTTSYGMTTTLQNVGSGASPVSVNAILTGLAPFTTYHYRLSGTNAGGTTQGSDQTFTTAAMLPTVTTTAATSVTSTGATLNGTVNPNGAPTTYSFEYGATTSYGSTTTVQNLSAGSSAVTVNAALTGLTPGSTYHYRVTATNAAGTAQATDQTFTTAGALVPTVTTSAASSVTATGAQLNGTANPNGTSTTAQFEYGTTTAYGTTTTAQSIGAGSSGVNVNATIGGLTPNTTYHYRITATNSAGSAQGSDQTFTTATAPPVVTTDTASTITGTSAQLNGTVNPQSSATTYSFEYGPTTSYGSTSPSQNAGSGAGPVSVNAVITGLTPNTTYHFRIVATNTVGTALGTDRTFTTPLIPPTVTTSSPTNVTASGARLNGIVNPNKSASTYYFQYGTTTSYGTATATQNAGSGASPVNATDSISGLTINTVYHYRIVATNSAGTTQGTDQTFTTGVISPTVATSTATNVTTTGAQLNGTVNPNGSSTTYRFEYGTTSSYGASTDLQLAGSTVAPVAVSAVLTGLTPGTTYHFRITASNAGGSVQGVDQTFATSVSLPNATTTAATAVAPTSAQLNGSVNPSGAATTYYFEYGLTTSYGAATTVQNAGSGSSEVVVNAAISGLNPSSTYHYRVVATNSAGTARGTDQTFTTGAVAAPSVITSAASGVTTTTAQLNGSVNPNGQATTYYFEYGTTTSYGSTTAVQNAGSGSAPATVNASLTGLTLGTQYYYRLVATNAAGTSRGDGLAFTTSTSTTSIVQNGGFESGTTFWTFFTNGTGGFTNDSAGYGSTHAGSIRIDAEGSNTQLMQEGITLEAGVQYRLSFRAYSSSGNDLRVSIFKTVTPYTTYGLTQQLADLTSSWQLFEYFFTATGFTGTATDGRLTFQLNSNAKAGDRYFLDDVILERASAVLPTVATTEATNVTTNAAQLNGTVNANGKATTYYFEYGPTTGYGSTTSTQSAGSGSAIITVFAAISGLTPNTTYHYRLVAQNTAGTAPGVDQSFTTAGSVTAPTVTTASATLVTATTAQLNGTVNPNGSQTLYAFEYGPTTPYQSVTPTANAGATFGAATVSASLISLIPNTTYHYRIVAQNSYGLVQGADQTFKTLTLDVNDEPAVPNTFTLYQNYPNPFNPATQIRFGIPTSARVRLRVYNLLGMEVADLANGVFEPGMHSVIFAGTNLVSGTYFYRLEAAPMMNNANGARAENFVEVKKLILLK
jgi:phosphodiesterase/alkaline phosphatase D-like protein